MDTCTKKGKGERRIKKRVIVECQREREREREEVIGRKWVGEWRDERVTTLVLVPTCYNESESEND